MSKRILEPGQICQVGIIVRNIKKSARRYAALFGVPEPVIIVSGPLAIAHTRYRGKPTHARARLAFFRLGPITIELIQPDRHPSTWREFLTRKGEGVHHIAFMVKGMGGVIRKLGARRMPAVQRGDYTGGRYTYIGSEKVLGVCLELLENFK